MARLSLAVLLAVLTGLILGVGGNKAVEKREAFRIQIQTVPTDDVLKWFCDENPFALFFSICDPYTSKKNPTSTTTKASILSSFSSSSSGTQQPTTKTTTQSTTPVAQPDWCQLPNGTYVPLGLTFMYSACDLCQCTQSHKIRCTTLQCMPTYCIDNTVPSRRAGQCCTQCAYEVNSTSCVQNGVTVPHGTMVRRPAENVQCWCQQGSIECRKSAASVLSSTDLWREGTAVYIVIILLCAFLVISTILCGGCAVAYYYYHYYTQGSADQAYWNNAGWQPMGEEEQVGDASAEQKQAEAEQTQYDQGHPAGFAPEYVPPPYALYNGTYEGAQTEKNQKYI